MRACLLTQSCPALCDPFVCNPACSSLHGIFQARILEWIALPSSREFSWPRDQTHVSCIGRQILHHWGTRKSLYGIINTLKFCGLKQKPLFWLSIQVKHLAWAQLSVSGLGRVVSAALSHVPTVSHSARLVHMGSKSSRNKSFRAFWGFNSEDTLFFLLHSLIQKQVVRPP